MLLPLRSAALLLIASLPLGACGSSGTTTSAALLSPQATGSLMPTGSVASQAATPGDPTDRALQVAATSARASRCGFYFDAGKLRAQFLAAEAAQGDSPEVLQKVERAYDYAHASVADATAKDASYCTDGKAAVIKADLNRHLAGDFSSRAKKAEPSTGLLAGLGELTSNNDTSFDPKKYFDITGKPANQN
jgi:hypothetical protein